MWKTIMPAVDAFLKILFALNMYKSNKAAQTQAALQKA